MIETSPRRTRLSHRSVPSPEIGRARFMQPSLRAPNWGVDIGWISAAGQARRNIRLRRMSISSSLNCHASSPLAEEEEMDMSCLHIGVFRDARSSDERYAPLKGSVTIGVDAKHHPPRRHEAPEQHTLLTFNRRTPVLSPRGRDGWRNSRSKDAPGNR